ncbi:LysR family transcriptional regulator [Shimwellia pseudoproteus]|uniref:LysR family transcriptional regulator n=1 Tax=Shimwellia pseudoproteus TaxID=570012 RepID=UPI0018EB6619|nr:LysR family transcriptional regulator [Shimwellia pseudoproteus]MBJ3814766.1 LysR family transcriptional regulator [Shimwellia pseudoproteus]
MKEYDLTALRSFVAVVDSGSFYHAAMQLEASSAAISRRISALEASLGVKLLNRTTRQLDVTPAGQQFYQDVTAVLNALEQAEERLNCAQETYNGTVRLGAPLSFGMKKLAPLLPQFMQQYPHITLQLHMDDRVTDMVTEGLDLSLRIGQLADSTLVSRRIALLPRTFCAAPDYLARHGTPHTPEQLQQHALLRYSLLPARDEWNLPECSQATEYYTPLAVNNGDVLATAAVAGMGIAMLPEFMVEDALNSGSLVRLLEDAAPSPLPLSLVRPSRQFTPVRVTALMQFLQTALAPQAGK